jgi:hypothetical protein
MGRLSSDAASRSRWLVTAMLAFHDESHVTAQPTTWELRLTDGTFTARAEGTSVTISAGTPAHADLVITTEDEHLHGLLTRRVTPADAIATGAVTLDGDVSALPPFVDLFAFPALDRIAPDDLGPQFQAIR